MKKITKDMLGLWKSPRDRRDYLVKSFVAEKKVPARFDITDKMTRVRSQGQEGACVGFAMVTGVKEYQEKKEHKRLVELSPRYLYEKAKVISGHSEGTTLRAAMEIALKCGVCEEIFWPYEANEVGAPLKGFEDNACKYRIKGYARITTVQGLKEAVYDPNIGATMIGVKVYKGMTTGDCRTSGVVPNPTCWERMNVLGGHALCVVGYDDESPFYKNDGHIKVKNSWGKNYGHNGYLYMSYAYIKANMIDAFSCIDIVGVEKRQIDRLGGSPEWNK